MVQASAHARRQITMLESTKNSNKMSQHIYGVCVCQVLEEREKPGNMTS